MAEGCLGKWPRKRRHRVITRPTGALPQRPRSNGSASLPRPVMPATTSKRSRHPGTSQSGRSPGCSCSSVVDTLDIGSEGTQASVDLLVAALHLSDVVDGAL